MAKHSANPPALPQLFQGFNERDWTRVRELTRELANGDLEPFNSSVGYVDLGKTEKGAAFVGARSFDNRGGGGLEYRKVYAMQWPR